MNIHPILPSGVLAMMLWLAAAVGWPATAQPPNRQPPNRQPPTVQPMLQHEHDEFEAFLEAPYRAENAQTVRQFVLTFNYPGAPPGRRVVWRLELHAPDGRVIKRWRGSEPLIRGAAHRVISWQSTCGRHGSGVYSLRMTAYPEGSTGAAIEQERDVAVGKPPALRMRPAAAPPMSLAGKPALEWDVYLGNLHSQTGHSDGGGPLDSCKGAQHPQSAAAGPAEAYAFAQQHGLQFLLASEHNHMYDGSEGTDPAADPLHAIGLYREGLAQAAAFSAANPGFVALYGLEWGVIANGGHLNILNSPELLAWERNGEGELLGDTFVAKGDYGALYQLMAQRGWLGQFNHPSGTQFRVGGKPLGYSKDGDTAMALCEVMNSNAFSVSPNEGEKRLGFYEKTCQRALEAGFHIAFSSNQDNHCANWGASSANRTGVLLPHGMPLTVANLLDGIRARRVFATMDKASTLALRANGAMMGERIENRGTLTLTASFANPAGRTASELVIVHGVPGRNGEAETITLAASEVTLAPEPGEHYYYARLTQDDGKVLWSAPVWVTQEPSSLSPVAQRADTQAGAKTSAENSLTSSSTRSSTTSAQAGAHR